MEEVKHNDDDYDEEELTDADLEYIQKMQK